MEKLITQYPWAFVAVMVLAIIGLIVFATHPDGFQPRNKKNKK